MSHVPHPSHVEYVNMMILCSSRRCPACICTMIICSSHSIIAPVPPRLQAGCTWLFVQVVVFARLTWWELSWDVMEPIAFILSMCYRWGGGNSGLI